MSVLSQCASVGANTGAIDCDVTRGNPISLIVGSGGFDEADYATQADFETAFEALMKLPSGSSNKLFPFPVIQGTTDKTVAAKTGNFGYGLEVKLLRSRAGYEFEVLAGTTLEKSLIKFDGKVIPVYVFDDQGNVWGVVDGAGTFKGAQFLLGVEPRGFGDANNVKSTKISISLVDPRDFVENAVFVSTSFSSTDLVGLVDVTLTEISNVTNVYKIGVVAKTTSLNSSINVAEKYSTILASASLWNASVDGAPLAITSVAYDSTLKAFTVTFDNTAFTALNTGDVIVLELDPPASLDTAGAIGIEGIPLALAPQP